MMRSSTPPPNTSSLVRTSMRKRPNSKSPTIHQANNNNNNQEHQARIIPSAVRSLYFPDNDDRKEDSNNRDQQQRTYRLWLPLIGSAATVFLVALFLVVIGGDQSDGFGFGGRREGGRGTADTASPFREGIDEANPPSHVNAHGKKKTYVPVPETHRRKVCIEGKGADTLIRAFRTMGWTIVDDVKDAHIYYRARGVGNRIYRHLQPWQRYSRIPGFSKMDSKDDMLIGFQQYQKKYPDTVNLYFLPETYLLRNKEHRKALKSRMDKNGGSGMNRPWVAKKPDIDNGKGIMMLGPNSKALNKFVTMIEKDELKGNIVVQSSICNELVWFKGEKIDLRFYWMIASIDPLIVLYHDGYVRVGGSMYNETDFSSTEQHLTNHEYRTDDQLNVTSEFLYQRIEEHYNEYEDIINNPTIQRQRQQQKTATTSFMRNGGGSIDPVQHVRNQLKEAIGTLGSVFRDILPDMDDPTNNNETYVNAENLFGFYGADFIIDADLDAYLIEIQGSPGFGENQYDFRIDMFRDLYRPMVNIIDEISTKQQQQDDGHANILPLQTLGGWEVVYAGDWQYKYEGYERSNNKRGCTTGD